MPKFNAPLDLSKSELRNAVVQNLSSAPASPLNGQVYYDTNTNTIQLRASGAWVALSTGTVADATTGAKGIVQLAGDLGGTGTTAAAPVITNLAITTGKIAANAVTLAKIDTTTILLSSLGNPTAAVNLNSQQINNLATPTTSTDAATKGYVDTTAQGLDVKPSARVATVGTETFTVASGSVTQIAGTTVDGVSPAIGDRILIKDAPAATGVGSVNSSQPGNGVYSVTANTTNLTVSRVTDQSGTELPAGDFVFVEAGTANVSSGWVVSSPSSSAAFTWGTTSLQWTQFSGAGEISAGTGLSKSGNTLSIENSGVLLPAHGGTGVASPTAFSLLVGNGSSAVALVAPSATSGLALVSGGSSANPSFAALNLTASGAVTNALPLANGGTAATSASAARTSLGTGSLYTTTFTGNGALTSFTVTPTPTPVLTGAWQVTTINQTTGAIEFCDVTINQSTSAITIAFTTAPANGLVYSVVVTG